MKERVQEEQQQQQQQEEEEQEQEQEVQEEKVMRLAYHYMLGHSSSREGTCLRQQYETVLPELGQP